MSGLKQTFKVGEGKDGLEVTLARPSYNQMREVAARVIPMLMYMSVDEQLLSDTPYEVMKLGADETNEKKLAAFFEADYTYVLELWEQFCEFARFDHFLVQREQKRLAEQQRSELEQMAMMADAGMKETIDRILEKTLSERLSTRDTQLDMAGFQVK